MWVVALQTAEELTRRRTEGMDRIELRTVTDDPEVLESCFKPIYSTGVFQGESLNYLETWCEELFSIWGTAYPYAACCPRTG